MNTFLSIHEKSLQGSLTAFDRLIFKGHLTMFYPKGAFARFLGSQKVLLKDFKPYVEGVSQQLKEHAEKVAAEAGRPFQYLQGKVTAKNGQGKEDLARQIMEKDQVQEGLICVFSTLETCSTFTVRNNREVRRLEVVSRKAKCLCFYFYYLDPQFGLMHVRLQSWFPFPIQIYVNGRECLARYLDQQHSSYERYENSFIQLADLPLAQAFCDKFSHLDWPPILRAFAQRVNPMLKVIEEARFGSYYWVINECEIATDLMFKDRATLEKLKPDLLEHLAHSNCEDVFHFLGRKINGNFKGQATNSVKKRPQGWRAKFSLKFNSIKTYDKFSVLRVETTINNPGEFKIYESNSDQTQSRWKPMRKGVSNLYRYAQVGLQANQRLLEHLAQANLKSKAIPHLDGLCRSITRQGKRFARFNPLTQTDRKLFAALLSGEFALNGFRNHDLTAKLYSRPPASAQVSKQRCMRTSRLIAKLRGHGLIAKVKNSRLYRLTKLGTRILFAVVAFYRSHFPVAFQSAS